MSVHKKHVKFFDRLFDLVYKGTRRLFKAEDVTCGLEILQVESSGQIVLVAYQANEHESSFSHDVLTKGRITEMLFSINHAHSHHDKSCRIFEFGQLDKGQIDKGYFLFIDGVYFLSLTFWGDVPVTYDLALSKKEIGDLEEVLRQALA